MEDAVKSLDGKAAIVTGSGSGIGAGVALALAKAGASVALVGIERKGLDETAATIAEAGGTSLVLPCDITKRVEVDAAVAETEKAFGPVWLLVNNAVANENHPIEDVDDANLDLVLRSAIYGSVYFMQACFPSMKEHGGRILNFGSGSATMGNADAAAYAIAKEGIRGLTKTTATGWGQYGITVNTICPLVETPLYAIWWKSLTDEQRETETALIPMRRNGNAETDIGAAVVFLAGPGGSYITSRTLHIDGGRAYYDR